MVTMPCCEWSGSTILFTGPTRELWRHVPGHMGLINVAGHISGDYWPAHGTSLSFDGRSFGFPPDLGRQGLTVWIALGLFGLCCGVARGGPPSCR